MAPTYRRVQYDRSNGFGIPYYDIRVINPPILNTNVFTLDKTPTFFVKNNRNEYENISNLTGASYNIKYTNGKYLMGIDLDGLYYSEDGENWTKNTSIESLWSGTTKEVYEISDNGLDVGLVCGSFNTFIIKSSDGGITFDEKVNNIGGRNLIYGDKWITISNFSGRLYDISYSYDAINWSSSTITFNNTTPTDIQPQDLYYDGSYYYACGIIGNDPAFDWYILKSSDGINWSDDISTSSYTFNYMTSYDGIYLFIDNSVMYYSDDNFSTFNQITSPSGGVYKIHHTDKWYAVGSQLVWSSVDGINWDDETPNFISTGTRITDFDSKYNPKGNS